MKKVVLILVLLLTVSFAFASNGVEKFDSYVDSEITYVINENASCTVTYTNSDGVTFSSTAETCSEAYENLSMHIEAR